MIIGCPHCQARLNLPDHLEGKELRCAICRQVFRADQEALKESVQAGSPESASGSVTPKPREEEKRPRAETRRFEDDDDYAENLGAGDFPRDSRELVENAKSLSRPAGYAMLAAFFVAAVGVVGNVAINIAELNMGLAQGPAEVAFTSSCHVLLFAPMVTFIGIGARSLLTLGRRGLIVTAIVMNFIFVLIAGCGWASNIALLGRPAQGFADGTALAMSSVSGLANLVAAIMAIRVLMFREVADAYAARAEERLRRRY
jgi:hypothetical protein